MPNQQQTYNTPEIIGVLLAGGQSTRMKRENKCLASLNNKTLLRHVIDRMSPQVQKLILSVNGSLSHFEEFKLPLITDKISGHAGPLAGIHAAMSWIQTHEPHIEWLLSTPTDTPFIPEDLAEKLYEKIPANGPAIIQATSGNRVHPICSLWPVALRKDLEEALNNNMRKVRLWTENYNVIKVDFPVKTNGDLELDPFFNINHPEDLDIAEKLGKAFNI